MFTRPFRLRNFLTNESLWAAVFMILIMFFTAIDIVADLGEGADIGHIILEGFIFLLGLAGLSFFIYRLTQQKQRLLGLEKRLETAHADAASWKERSKTLIDGLGAKIDEQFKAWGLSPSEEEVARLLLKGLSSREIADIRSSSEKTVRAQSTAVYKKAKVANRQELLAFFLEDLS